jgi:hypothetical protein
MTTEIAFRLMLAISVLLESATEVAVTTAYPSHETGFGAEYFPFASIDPQLSVLQPVTAHVTAVFADPVTEVDSCCESPPPKVTDFSLIVTFTGTCVTVAEPNFVLSDCNAASTVTVAAPAIFAGAVYKPLALIVPQPSPLQPETDQITAVAVVPETVAVNCLVSPPINEAVAGDMETLTR